jgi:NDP-sugar pyrophosphorylase family protein
VIIAAGDGGRLYPLTSDTPKPLLKLHGRPIINHVLDALRDAGVDDVVVVLGYRGEQIRRALEELSPCGMRIRYVENDEFMLGNARSIWAARAVVDGSFLLAMSDHLVEPDLARALIDDADGRCRLAVEHTHAGDGRAGEATLAHVREGRVIDLGKSIPEWNALDTGLFWCTPRIFDAMTGCMRDGEAGAVFASLARSGELDAADVSGRRWMDIDTVEDLRLAGEMLATGALWRNGYAHGA